MQENETVKYYIVAFQTDKNKRLFYNIDSIKDIARRANYRYKEKEEQKKLFLYSINPQSIQILISSVNKLTSIDISTLEYFIEEIKEIAKETLKGEEVKIDISYSQEINKETALELILEQKSKNKLTFDLVTAVDFHEDIKAVAKAEFYSPPSNYNRRFNSDNETELNRHPPRRNPYNEPEITIKSNEEIQSILSSLHCKNHLENEITVLNNMNTKIKAPINYIISTPYKGLNEENIIGVILSQQHINRIFESRRISKLKLDQLISPHPFRMFRQEDIALPHFVRDNPIIMENSEVLENTKEDILYNLADMLKTHTVPVVFLIDKSKVLDEKTLDRNISKLKSLLRIRELNIDVYPEDEYMNNVEEKINKLGFKLNRNVDTAVDIEVIKDIYGERLKADKIKVIAENIVFKHILYSKNNSSNDIDINIIKDKTVKEDIEETGFEKLDKLIGLYEAKEKVKQFLAHHRMNAERKKQGLRHEEICKHIILKGNPGTGKTTFARILAQIFKEENILNKGHIVETSRDGLVAKYVGWTAQLVNEKFKEAMDGVLFIDEAYLLGTDAGHNRGFGSEAIGSIVKNMEDLRDKVVVVMAGYSQEMEDLLDTNPGLADRIGLTLDMPDFSAEELLEVFNYFTLEKGYIVSQELGEELHKYLNNVVQNKGKNFGNARFIRKVFERILLAKSQRLILNEEQSKEALSTLDIEDFNIVLKDKDLDFSNSSSKAIQIGFRG